MSNYMTYGDVARALETTHARAKSLLKDVAPELVVGNGRVVMFTEKQVRDAVYSSVESELKFLGYLSQDESYDVLIDTASN